MLAIAYPAQGHVKPLMKLSHQIADRGIKVTFVNAESIHARVSAEVPEEKGEEQNRIEMVSIPDGLEQDDGQKDKKSPLEYMSRVMPAHLEDLSMKINLSDDNEKITCVIADVTFGWALEIAKKMGIKRAMFWPAMAGSFALGFHIPKLIEDGIIDNNGTPMKSETIHLSQNMPSMSPNEFIWSFPADPILQKKMFRYWRSGIDKRRAPSSLKEQNPRIH